jgi:formylglycine-generating enzyme required for sulfatase activity
MKYIAGYGMVIVILGLLVLCGCGKDEPTELPKTIKGKDGAPMVLIPAGEFQMGGNDHDNEKPIHTVYVDAFYMDKYEVTNKQYGKFMDATGYKAPRYWSDSKYNAPEQPVVSVSWHDAAAYAKWSGKRLPTEAEWEKAARGDLTGKKYPWGDKLTHDDANYKGTGGKDRWDNTSPVGSFSPNGYGLYDMTGNVCEWCSDWLGENYYSSSPKRNPTGPSSGEKRVLRGGEWFYFPSDNLRCAGRSSSNPTYTILLVGFRCVE